MKTRETVVVFVLLLGIYASIAHCTACTPFAPADGVRVLDVAGYTAALAQCREEGKDAGRYIVYSKCADEADRKYGLGDAGAP